ncbi:MAG: SLBB domain-containing protein [Candidatus Krumholzibacteriota bacterium]|nr:SLBB domain-containing protein [Candidatus Krumholzibacteriota bacterium]
MRDLKRTLLLLLVAALILPAGPVGAQISERRLVDDVDSGADEVKKEKEPKDLLTGDLMRLEQAIDPDEYILGPNDGIIINLVGPQQRSFTLSVLPEGVVFIPGMGALTADGLTLTQFRELLAVEVEKYFHDIEVYCYLLQPRVFRVFVTGEVGIPGPVDVSAVERVSDAVEKAGSIISSGSNRQVLLERDGKNINVDILRFVVKGDFRSNPFLSNGDRIHVPVAGGHVLIRGSVKKSAVYEIIEGETFSDIIDLAGGFTSEALCDTLLLSRVLENGTVSTIAVPESDFTNMILQDRDEINVMDAMTGTSRVYVFGATEKTGHYYITDGERLTELVGRIGRFNPDADLAAASIERSDGEIIRIDLKDYIPPSLIGGLTLKDGDMLHIPSISRMVAVGGEVVLPGRFAYEGDWTVAQYVGLAGGPKKEGSMDRIVIYSPDGRSRKGDRNMRPNRGDVIIVKRSKGNIFGGFFTLFVNVGTVVITMIVLTR